MSETAQLSGNERAQVIAAGRAAEAQGWRTLYATRLASDLVLVLQPLAITMQNGLIDFSVSRVADALNVIGWRLTRTNMNGSASTITFARPV